MKTRCLGWCNVLLMVVVTGTLAMTPLTVADDDDATTEDVLFLEDGRELHGNIIEERRDAIIFEFIDRRSGIRTKLTLLLEEIAKISRDVPVVVATEEGRTTGKRSPAASQPDEETPERTYGARRAETYGENVPKFYMVPMKGQMGTDVNAKVYRDLVEDIRAHDPDYLIIVMECLDEEERLYSRIDEADAGLHGSTQLDMYREVVDLFQEELRDLPQVLWIHDSMGISSVVALSWPDMYMMEKARFGGLDAAAANFLRVRSDENTFGKYREAYMAWLKGFAEHGGYDLDLLDAMVRPEFALSATWKGRAVDWRLDKNGEYLVDESDKETVTFKARDAENFCISDGTAETAEDLALLMGIREFHIVEGEADEIFEKYRTDWRRALENCKTAWENYQKYNSWASGDDAIQYLGRAKKELERMIALMERYDAVELRVGMELGISKFDLITYVEQIKEQLRAMRQATRGRRGGGRPPGGAGSGG